MAKIVYEDKVPLQDDPDVQETNKVTADNMNVLKNGINDLLTALGLLVDTWVSGASYAVGDQEVYNGINYECTTANSDTTFDVSKWTAVPILVPDDDDDSSSAKENIISEEE